MAVATRPSPTEMDADRCTPATRVTRSLLGYGALAGPFYVAVAIGQALLRPGFDLTHDDVSLLANGDFGWIQILNFVLTGAMVIAFAIGLRRAFVTGRGATWAPRMIAGFGVGLILAGIFSADPMNGFPAGAPAGHPATVSLHGLLHIAAAGVGFACFVVACLAMSRRFASLGESRWRIFSIVTGVAFLAGFAGVASGSGSSGVVLAFWCVLLLAWAWLAALAVRTYVLVGRGKSGSI